MDTNELLSRVRRVEIKTRALTNNIFAGEYHSAFKGRGMSFAEVREYQAGDDVRDIDWNVTARTGRTHLKVFEEERELTVMLLIDVSRSMRFGLHERTERDLAAEIAATIAFSAIENKDKIGVVFFSDRIEQYIPPQKGRKHILFIIRSLLTLEPQGRHTDIGCAVEFLMKVQRRRCVAFLMSDFIGRNDYAKPLRIAKRKHDVVAIKLFDHFMAELPRVGLLKVIDAETGHEHYVDTSSKGIRQQHSEWWNRQQATFEDIMHHAGVNTTNIATNGDYVRALRTLFSKGRR